MKTIVRDTTSKKIKLSIHPKLAAVFDILIGIVLVWFFAQVVTAWWVLLIWFLFRLVWWIALMRFVYYAPVVRRIDHLWSLIAFQVGISTIMLFIDWSVNWYSWGTIFVFGSALSFWLLPAMTSELSFVGKPHTRWCLMLTILGIAGVWSSVGAVVVFYSIRSWIVALILATAWTVMLSISWWRQYDAPRGAPLLWWGSVMGIIILEISGVMVLWPIGFLLSGMLITWLWYSLWLMGRFYFSNDGINWKKQGSFLIGSLLIMIITIITLGKWK
jgi:hypothetical protein